MKNLLIYLKDRKTMETLNLFLKQDGYQVFWADSGSEAYERVSGGGMQLMLMDIGVKEEGLLLLKTLRQSSGIPILILSENDTERAKIAALNAGADDYVTLPYHPLELMARINSQFQRYLQLAKMCENINQIYRVDELEIDDSRRKVTVAGSEVRLTPLEYKILRLLVQERGKVFSIGQIYESIWNMQAVGVDNTIAVHIRHIREKIERNPKNPKYLKVVWGTGYKVG